MLYMSQLVKDEITTQTVICNFCILHSITKTMRDATYKIKKLKKLQTKKTFTVEFFK